MILEFASLTFYIPALQIKCIGLYILLAIRSCVVRGFEDIQDICLISRMWHSHKSNINYLTKPKSLVKKLIWLMTKNCLLKCIVYIVYESHCFFNTSRKRDVEFHIKSVLFIPSPTLELDPPLVSNLFFLKSKQSFLSLNSYLLFYFIAFPMPESGNFYSLNL